MRPATGPLSCTRPAGAREDRRRRSLFPALVGRDGDDGGLGSALEGGWKSSGTRGMCCSAVLAEADEFLADHPGKRE